jgi:hypothetical protein
MMPVPKITESLPASSAKSTFPMLSFAGSLDVYAPARFLEGTALTKRIPGGHFVNVDS